MTESDQPDPVVRLVEPQLPEVRVLRVQPGDILVVRVPALFTQQEAALVRAQFELRFPDNDVAVLAGADVVLMRTEPEPAEGIAQWESDLLDRQQPERE